MTLTYHNVTDRQTDGQTRSSYSLAEQTRGKNELSVSRVDTKSHALPTRYVFIALFFPPLRKLLTATINIPSCLCLGIFSTKSLF